MIANEPSGSSHDAGESGGRTGHRPPRREVWLGAVLVLLVCVFLNERRLWRPDTTFSFRENVQIAEAQAWWQGRLNLPERVHDTAFKDGQVYSHFPPMFTIIAVVLVPFYDGVPHWFVVILAGIVPVCAYVLLYRRTCSPLWAAILAIGYVCGTSVWPVFRAALTSAMPYHVNHMLASTGLLLILIEYFGRRRVWPAAIGFGLTALSRQLTVLYMLPLAYMACCAGSPRGRWKRAAWVVVTGLVVAGVYGGLNTLKFGHPLATGYRSIYVGRDDGFARDARAHGTVSIHWVGRNLYYTNLGLPNVHRSRVGKEDRIYLRPNNLGTGIWWTSPMLLWLFAGGRRLLRARPAVVLLAAGIGVFALLMVWHSTGANQRGYNRYSLDYIPVVLALLAPYAVVGWRRWVTLGMIAWSVVYFRFLLALPQVQIWSSVHG